MLERQIERRDCILLLSPDDQLAVIKGLRNGSRDAWAVLCDAYSEDIWRYAARLLGPDKAAVDDVVQETFLGAAQSARQFDSARGTLRSWLCGIAHHHVARHWQQLARADRLRKLAEFGAEEIQHWLDRSDPTVDVWNRAELVDLIRGVLAELSVGYAMVLLAKYSDERSLADIACENGESIDATKSKLARARREFRDKFEFLNRRASQLKTRLNDKTP